MTNNQSRPNLGEHIVVSTLMGDEEAIVRSVGTSSATITVEFSDRVRITARLHDNGRWVAY